VTVRLNVPGNKPEGSLATIRKLVKELRASELPLKRTVGVIFEGSKPDPVRVI
jgi:hypothetical protein